MEKTSFLILAINPGSTSTKLAIFDGEKQVIEETIRHQREELDACGSVPLQKELRMKYAYDMLSQNNIDISELDAIVGRGGLIKPLDSGVYNINDNMLKDLATSSAALHASSLGGLIASEMGRKNGIPNFVVDPVVVDEMEPQAKLSGVPGVERRSTFHALNTKAVARKAAQDMGMQYENGRFIVAHLGGGITVGAHRYGRVIDVNDGLAGEGPFSPERCGAAPVLSIIDMCFSGDFTKKEMQDLCTSTGGVRAYLGTNDMRVVEKMIKGGDDYAALVLDSMAYQVAKEIGAMAAVLDGRVDAIVLTGGLAYSNRFTGSIKQRVDLIAKVVTYPGEDEMRALVEGALAVLEGRVKALEYA